MRRMLAIVLVLFPALAIGQVRPGFAPPEPIRAVAVVNQPYSGDLVYDTVTTNSDGVRTTRSLPNLRLYRDSAGRTRQEGPIFLNAGGQPVTPLIVITDPIAGFQYTLDPKRNIAHRRPLTAPVDAAPAPETAGGSAPAASPSPSRVKAESLGANWIEGVHAEGTRHWVERPADASATAPAEVWLSPELQVLVLRRWVDADGVEHANRLTRVSRSEPDAGLFLIPASYSVVDESGPFSILP